MLKKNLAFLIALTIFLSGCGGINQDKRQNENNIPKTISESESIASSSSEEDNKTETQQKPNDKIASDSEKSNSKSEAVPVEGLEPSQEAFTPLLISDTSSLSTKAIPWSWLYSPRDSAGLLSKYKGYGFGDTTKKIIYLTFDEGYENGYTSSILDTLKLNNVHAAFFVTKPYVTGSYNGVPDSELLKRMSKEGHIIGNHSVQHKSMPTFTNETAFDAELTGVEDSVNSIPGCKMSKYFRPPEGTFSELSLYYTQKLGYKSIFFALAYQDYNVDNQPAPEAAKEMLLKNTRNGMICLLHAVSKTNASILDSMIKEWKNEGYEFRTLDELPN
ncbi:MULTISPECIES: polysaccharide deacetylase family protein [unclassified Clostridium]|uniref:polysaccharide deacetylase family protein n=1 Tax=unclassified Clostridium TaxID=2614128 RepID=UPI0002981449|nr:MULTISPECIES: polysaccharide deacetylase family protein [unclassified Clostridium]EKQ58287.1 MAG: putative xylanase/chitin deacetylase [Clostridium sp. Maddingley MBC34-26]